MLCGSVPGCGFSAGSGWLLRFVKTLAGKIYSLIGFKGKCFSYWLMSVIMCINYASIYMAY